MAEPDIVNVTSIKGQTQAIAVGMSATDLVAVTPTDKIYKMNMLLISNVHATDAATITLTLNRSTALSGVVTTGSFHIAKSISIPAGATLDVLSKPLYLMEGDKIVGQASAASSLESVASYEVIDDA